MRWGILGTGAIARMFSADLKLLPSAEVTAVGSRATETAAAFATDFDIPRHFGSYSELAACPEVDVIYIATPHPMHRENMILCLEHGKHVLCEKPFTLNLAEAEEVLQVAKERKVFVMEAMWTRFLPAIDLVRELEDQIGEPKMFMGDFGFRAPYRAEGRIFDPALGGGSLLDVGVYPISLACMFFGPPSEVHAAAHLGETGVDELTGVVLRYNSGKIALLSSAVTVSTPQEATLIGTAGRVRFWPIHEAREVSLVRADGAEEHFSRPPEGRGMQYQAEHLMRCVRDSVLESPIMSHQDTKIVMEVMDQARSQFGLRYPVENV